MIYAACAATLVACPSNPRETEKSQKRVDLAKDLLAQGQDAAAESEGKKAVAFDARNEEAHQILGKIFIVRANRNVGLIEREGCLEGTVADGLRAEANADMRRADEYLARAVELAPDLGEAWMDRSVIAIYFQDWDKAIEYGQKALAGLAKLQNEALARANLGWAHFQRGDLARAAQELLQATQREHSFCLGNYRLGEVLFQQKEYEDAAERLAPFLDPTTCPIQQLFYLMGNTYLRLNDPQSAAKQLDMCIAMAPRSCVARQCDKALKQLTP